MSPGGVEGRFTVAGAGPGDQDTALAQGPVDAEKGLFDIVV
jgi:hypothetical protein